MKSMLVSLIAIIAALCMCLPAWSAYGTVHHKTPPHRAEPPVITPDLQRLPWTMDNGVKVFHLTAEVVKREILPATGMAPAKVLTVFGYNGSAPGPTIEVNEGDRVRIVFQNNLPEGTTIHWHGLEIPINMDGMPFISQPMVNPGQKFIYEFTLHQNGTFFYHSHGAMQEMMGMIGFFIIHPKVPNNPPVQRDFALCLQEWAALPNNNVPNSMSMEFNWLTINGKAAPATTPLIAKVGDRIRIRLINMGMDHHPIHIHGNQFYVTGTEGGRIPETAWYPGNTVLVGVAQARDIEFVAKYPGDWMLHCHLPHHMMNNMVSMVGPMTHVGMGMHTGMAMQEGMGMIREGAATDENLGPGLGRGMGNTADREQATSNAVGHPAVNSSDQNPPSPLSAPPPLGSDTNSQKSPAYPQDDMMMMSMDAAVAKPENNYLAPGWSGALAGMMNLIRVLPADKYDRVMADIKAHHIDPAQLSGGMNMPGMDMNNMPGMKMDQGGMNTMPGMKMDQGGTNNMPGMKMDHGGMNNMPGMKMDHGGMNNMPGMKMDHGGMNMPGMKMDHGGMNMPGMKMDHGGMNMPGMKMDHGGMNMPGMKMDHGGMNMPGMNHGGMNMPGMKMDHGGMNMPGMKVNRDKMESPQKAANKKTAGAKSKAQAKQKPMTMEEMMKKNPNMKM